MVDAGLFGSWEFLISIAGDENETAVIDPEPEGVYGFMDKDSVWLWLQAGLDLYNMELRLSSKGVDRVKENHRVSTCGWTVDSRKSA